MTTLTAVRTALTSSNSGHASFLVFLLDKGNIGPYRCKPESKVRRLFGPSDAHFPQLGKKVSPFDANKLPKAEDLRELCLRDFKETREYFGDRTIYFTPFQSKGDEHDSNEADAILNLICTIDDAEMDLEATGQAIVFQSEGLEELLYEGSEEHANCLHRSMTTCTILTRNTILPLQHSNEGTTTTTLLSGSVIWIIWPPTDHNLSILQSIYENFEDNSSVSSLDVATELEGGIILVQVEGEGLRVPPFCPIMLFAPNTSVLATHSSVTALNYISMLQRVPLLKAWFRTELNGDVKQSNFNAAVLKWLDLLLNGSIDTETGELDETYKLSFDEHGPLAILLEIWDRVKGDVEGILGPADSKVVKDIWSAFLVQSKGRECRICGNVIRNKQKLMRKHFEEHHWPKKKVAERVVPVQENGVSIGEDNEEAGVHERAMDVEVMID